MNENVFVLDKFFVRQDSLLLDIVASANKWPSVAISFSEFLFLQTYFLDIPFPQWVPMKITTVKAA